MDEHRETIGALFANKIFMVKVLNISFTVITFLGTIIAGLWIQCYDVCPWAALMLIIGNYAAALGMFSALVAWILIDESGWFGQSIYLAITGSIMIIPALHFMTTYFDERQIDKHFNASLTTVQQRADHQVFELINLSWYRVIICVNFFQGILYFVYLITAVIAHDNVQA